MTWMRAVLLSAAVLIGQSVYAQAPSMPAPRVDAPAVSGTPVPLLSLDLVNFLEGSWSATSRDGKTDLGAYTFARELNRQVFARHKVADAHCDPAQAARCARQSLFYIYQDAPGAPLQGISFDSEGHVVRYFITLTSEGSTSTLGRRDFIICDSDPSQLGPRVRLRYEHNVDLRTGRDVLNGEFDELQPDGVWRSLEQWYGTRL